MATNKEGSKPLDLAIIDITDKKSIICPNCGSTQDIPLRTIGVEKLRHMQEVKRLFEWRKKHVPGLPCVGNARLMICLGCGQPIIGTDQFSLHIENREE